MGYYDDQEYWDSDYYWRHPDKGGYDGKGYWRSPGEGGFDSEGCWRNSTEYSSLSHRDDSSGGASGGSK